MVQAINTPLIELINAGVDFAGEQCLAPLSFNVTRGEFVCLHGATGSGKTLALNLISGLVRPTRGEVRVAGELINDFNDRQTLWLRRTMGIMAQDALLLDDRSILENVMLPALASEESFSEARRRARAALAECDILDLADARPSDISAGQKQIACLARAIVNHPVVILADEPAAHLDANNAQHLMDQLGEVSLSGVAVIVASHLQLTPNTVASRPIRLYAPAEMPS